MGQVKKYVNVAAWRWFGFMVLNAIFNNIVVVSFIDRGNRRSQRKPPTCRKSLTNFITTLYQVCLAWAGFELVVIDTNCTGSCKSNYHTIMTTTAPKSKKDRQYIDQRKILLKEVLNTTTPNPFFDLWLLITPLLSSNFSCIRFFNTWQILINISFKLVPIIS